MLDWGSSAESLCCVLEQDTLAASYYWKAGNRPNMTEKFVDWEVKY